MTLKGVATYNATWFCDRCGAKERTVEIETVTDPARRDVHLWGEIPENWFIKYPSEHDLSTLVLCGPCFNKWLRETDAETVTYE